MNIIENDIKLAEKSIYTAEIEIGKACSFPNDINAMPYNNSNAGKPYFSGFPSKYDTTCECYTAQHFVGKVATTPNNLSFFIFSDGLKVSDAAAKSIEEMESGRE